MEYKWLQACNWLASKLGKFILRTTAQGSMEIDIPSIGQMLHFIIINILSYSTDQLIPAIALKVGSRRQQTNYFIRETGGDPSLIQIKRNCALLLHKMNILALGVLSD